MNNVSNTESLVEFYHLPGLGVKETATILTTGTHDSCHAMYSRHKRTNEVLGDTEGYRYIILPTADAERLVKATNYESAKDLAEFRNKVYGEPIPAEFAK
jgi:hypothetical protein